MKASNQLTLKWRSSSGLSSSPSVVTEALTNGARQERELEGCQHEKDLTGDAAGSEGGRRGPHGQGWACSPAAGNG